MWQILSNMASALASFGEFRVCFYAISGDKPPNSLFLFALSGKRGLIVNSEATSEFM
jgi:hypothetical protein